MTSPPQMWKFTFHFFFEWPLPRLPAGTIGSELYPPLFPKFTLKMLWVKKNVGVLRGGLLTLFVFSCTSKTSFLLLLNQEYPSTPSRKAYNWLFLFIGIDWKAIFDWVLTLDQNLPQFLRISVEIRMNSGIHTSSIFFLLKGYLNANVHTHTCMEILES